MKEKKKLIISKIPKKTILAFIICAITFSMIGATASTLLYSKDVTYDNSGSGLSATNLQDALDELYEQAKSGGASVSCDDDNNCTVTCKQGEPTMNANGYSCTTITTATVECPSGMSFIATSTGYKCKLGIKTTDLIESVVTNGSGLYVDSYENERYIYRGPNPDNYITFNGESAGWRIISVESDGTIKIMKISSLGNRVYDAKGNRMAYGYCGYASEYGCNAWASSSTTYSSSGTAVTYMPKVIGKDTYQLPTNIASLNAYLNGTYYNSLSSTAQSQIVSHNFNIGLLAHSYTQTTATDVSQENAYKWKGKIALSYASDYVRASTNSNCTGAYAMYSNSSCYDNSSSYNWMYNSSISSWWTLSPFSGNDADYVWRVYSGGKLQTDYAYLTNGVRPVVFLSSNITLSGSGTESDPYTIK